MTNFLFQSVASIVVVGWNSPAEFWTSIFKECGLGFCKEKKSVGTVHESITVHRSGRNQHVGTKITSGTVRAYVRTYVRTYVRNVMYVRMYVRTYVRTYVGTYVRT